jgi:hypothetical protein
MTSVNEISIEYRGKQITASLGRGQTATTDAVAQSEPAVWYVSIGGTALTKLPASPADSEETVRTRILQWLRENPDMLDRDQIVLGGG